MRSAPPATANVAPPLEGLGSDRLKFNGVRLLTIYVVLLTLIPATLIFEPLGGTGTPAMVCAFCILLAYLAFWMSGRLKPSGGGRLIRIALLIFALTVLLSFVAAMTRDVTGQEVLAADSGIVWLIGSAGLVIVATQTITDYSRLEVLLRRLVILGCVVAVIGLLQFVGIDLTQIVHIPGLSVNSAAITVTVARNGFSRVQGTASQPIEFGVVLAMLVPLALQQAFDPAYGGRLRRWVPVALITFASMLSISRSAVLGLGTTLVIMFPTWKPRRQLAALGVLVLGAAVVHQAVHGLIGTFRSLFDGIFNGQDSSVNDRLADYGGVAQYLDQRPLFGRGFGTFLPLVYRYTDNMYLLAIIEIGLVGVVAMFFVFVAGAQTAIAGRKKALGENRREMGQALFACMAIAAVTSATFDSLSFPMFSGVFFLLLGCCGAYRMLMDAEADNPALMPTSQLSGPGSRPRSHVGSVLSRLESESHGRLPNESADPNADAARINAVAGGQHVAECP
jgi:O-antigen ligase